MNEVIEWLTQLEHEDNASFDNVRHLACNIIRVIFEITPLENSILVDFVEQWLIDNQYNLRFNFKDAPEL